VGEVEKSVVQTRMKSPRVNKPLQVVVRRGQGLKWVLA
jgi:hypothetical protein